MVRLTVFLIFLFSIAAEAQSPVRFRQEVDDLLKNDSAVDRQDLILFTGSSSIRLWNDLPKRFADYNVINRGFGGSQMHDLLFFSEELILQYKPRQIFIYEGDNDVSLGKTPGQIISTADSLVLKIQSVLGKRTEIFFISAKPSIKRWSLREKYLALNDSLRQWTHKHKKVKYVDVWTPMLNNDGSLKQELFVEDGLHMNAQGYDIWTQAITPFLRRKFRK